MKKLMVPVLSTGACIGVVLAGAPQPSNDPAVVNAVRQVEQDMGEAMVRADVDRLSQIYADGQMGSRAQRWRQGEGVT